MGLQPHGRSDKRFNPWIENRERGLRFEYVHSLFRCIVGMPIALLQPGFVVERLARQPFAAHLRLAIPAGGQCHQHQQDNQATGPKQSSVTDDLTHILGRDGCKHVSSS